ncbi:SHOCT domain-containing protein [Thermosipho atlanticus]|uniref:Putative membrane protein n=1 Tax=Thermosipho atlanticus DSM 15807 TaxID=1123380 RepID=A0A1M5T1D8_9BACT|nr:SHOCT domain-containing protein [Thermosipho atlanticus]SHH44476.1 putative membrane protein [Thermosipho atlanticus DSM 15807]
MCWFWGPYGWFGGWIGSLIGLIIFGIILYLGYKLFKSLTISNSNQNNSALKILNEKLVKGEISEEEYLRKKAIISKNK